MMKPVIIFEHIESSGPGLFETFLKQRSIPFRILRVNQGDEVPEDREISECSGLCFLGGTESVTEPTDAMLREISLIRVAKTNGTPVIGHCLGGQLISKALGGEVSRHSLVEFGWSSLYAEDNQAGLHWVVNTSKELKAMQWHNDAFTIPQGATRILNGDYCANQAFVYGNILAMQFHIEIDAATIKHWAVDLVEKHPEVSESVQSGEQIMESIDINFAASRKLAEQLYSNWLENVH